MKVSELFAFLSGQICAQEFLDKNSADIEHYANKMGSSGSSIQFTIDEDYKFCLSIEHILKLCYLYLNNSITEIQLAYLCDYITLTENIEFQDEKVKDVIYDIADPEINGIITKKRAHEIIGMFE